MYGINFENAINKYHNHIHRIVTKLHFSPNFLNARTKFGSLLSTF
jgi:hypothetical protein